MRLDTVVGVLPETDHGLCFSQRVTVLAEAPRIGQHREAIRQRIAEVAGVPLSSVSIKATTTEKLGFVGRAEGLAAHSRERHRRCARLPGIT